MKILLTWSKGGGEERDHLMKSLLRIKISKNMLYLH